MAKRGPGSEMNDRNWDEEDEPEEAGIFVQATKDVIDQRMIKKAKRRVIGDSAGSKSSAFSGFSGFGAKTTTLNTDVFSGIKKLDGDSISTSKPSVFGGTSSFNGNEDQKVKGHGDSKESSSYLGCLKSLNESVLAWIKQHVDSNPYIILTPVFKDYGEYLEVIQAEKSVASNVTSAKEEVKDDQGTDNVASASTKVISSVLPTTKPEDDKGKQSEVAKTKPFTFGQTLAEPSKPFMFGQTSAESPSQVGFSFTPSTTSSTGAAVKFTSASSTPGAGFFFSQTSSGTSSAFGKSSVSSAGSANSSQGLFSFGKTNSSQESTSAEGSQDTGEKDGEEYEPPKPEVKEIVEADALYSKRCKLYYQKDGQWVDRGVGNLHLKPVADNKTQLLVRADTNLGNILLNIMLQPSTPVSRQGKNNVTLVCVPNPPLSTGEGEGTPVPMLVRVKTGEDADQLLGKIEERKKLL